RQRAPRAVRSREQGRYRLELPARVARRGPPAGRRLAAYAFRRPRPALDGRPRGRVPAAGRRSVVSPALSPLPFSPGRARDLIRSMPPDFPEFRPPGAGASPGARPLAPSSTPASPLERLRALPPGALRVLRRGIEKESLRTDRSGRLAATPHPVEFGSALAHPH